MGGLAWVRYPSLDQSTWVVGAGTYKSLIAPVGNL